jgi:hypothetical protein
MLRRPWAGRSDQLRLRALLVYLALGVGNHHRVMLRCCPNTAAFAALSSLRQDDHGRRSIVLGRHPARGKALQDQLAPGNAAQGIQELLHLHLEADESVSPGEEGPGDGHLVDGRATGEDRQGGVDLGSSA